MPTDGSAGWAPMESCSTVVVAIARRSAAKRSANSVGTPVPASRRIEADELDDHSALRRRQDAEVAPAFLDGQDIAHRLQDLAR